jgi:hypothetical protein
MEFVRKNIRQELIMKTLLSLLVISFLLLIGACQSGTVIDENTGNANPNPVMLLQTPITVDSITQTPAPDSVNGNEGILMPNSTTTSDAKAQRMAQIAKESLAQEFKVRTDQIQIKAIKAVVWSDSSLGCPQIGITYTQVLTSGFLVRLEAQEQQYLYHTDENWTVILCAGNVLPEFPVTPDDIQDGLPWMPIP